MMLLVREATSEGKSHEFINHRKSSRRTEATVERTLYYKPYSVLDAEFDDSSQPKRTKQGMKFSISLQFEKYRSAIHKTLSQNMRKRLLKDTKIVFIKKISDKDFFLRLQILSEQTTRRPRINPRPPLNVFMKKNIIPGCSRCG